MTQCKREKERKRKDKGIAAKFSCQEKFFAFAVFAPLPPTFD